MELMAVVEALKSLKNPYEIEIISDSQYVCKSINEWLAGWIKKNFKGVKNLELWKEYIEISKKHKIKATWVKAHDGHPENEECDRISKQEAEKFL
jgi:ribonuclease HI